MVPVALDLAAVAEGVLALRQAKVGDRRHHHQAPLLVHGHHAAAPQAIDRTVQPEPELRFAALRQLARRLHQPDGARIAA